MDTVIKVEHLSKQYRIGAREGYRTFRETLVDAAKAPFVRLRGALSKEHRAESSSDSSPKSPDSTLSALSSPLSAVGGRSSPELIWALRDVSFEVKQGEVVGIIGRNGAGKSTLLKILSRITEPTEGRVELRGRVGSLLEVGTGFHPELTGHENIYLYGAILGMDRWEVTRKFDEIVGFAELEKFIDTPVKKYSSGMYMRLAFAVAAHLEPEILLVDEVLAVGDAAFQKKCLGKMGDVSKEGRTVLFVSHNMAAIQNLCSNALLLHQGNVAAQGNTSSVIRNYMEMLSVSQSNAISDRKDRAGDGRLRFVGFCVADSSSGGHAAVCGTASRFILRYKCVPPLRNVHVSIGFYTMLGEGVLYVSNDLIGKYVEISSNEGSFVCGFAKLPLLPGSYFINLYCTAGGQVCDWVKNAVRLDVEDGDFFGTGKLPPKGYGAIVAPFDLEVVPQ